MTATRYRVGDQVYVKHPKRGPVPMVVRSVGADGVRATCDLGKGHRVPWRLVLGLRKAIRHERRQVVDQGADGVLVAGRDGVRHYVSNKEASAPAPEPPSPSPAEPERDNPLTGRLDLLRWPSERWRGAFMPDTMAKALAGPAELPSSLSPAQFRSGRDVPSLR